MNSPGPYARYPVLRTSELKTLQQLAIPQDIKRSVD